MRLEVTEDGPAELGGLADRPVNAQQVPTRGPIGVTYLEARHLRDPQAGERHEQDRGTAPLGKLDKQPQHLVAGESLTLAACTSLGSFDRGRGGHDDAPICHGMGHDPSEDRQRPTPGGGSHASHGQITEPGGHLALGDVTDRAVGEARGHQSTPQATVGVHGERSSRPPASVQPSRRPPGRREHDRGPGPPSRGGSPGSAGPRRKAWRHVRCRKSGTRRPGHGG